MGIHESCSAPVQRAFHSFFYVWGTIVGRRPCVVLWTSLIIAIVASIRLPLALKTPLESVVEQDQLWVPQKAQAIDDKERYNDAFSTVFRRNLVYVTTSPAGGNVLTSSILNEVLRFDRMVRKGLNATGFAEDGPEGGVYPVLDFAAVSASGTAVAHGDVCATSTADNATCLTFDHPLELFFHVGEGAPVEPFGLPGEFDLELTDAEINEIVTAGRGTDTTLFPEGSERTVNVEAIFGGIERDATGAVTGAKALQLSYLLEESPQNTPLRDAVEAWEDQLNLLCGAKWTNDPPLSEGSANPPDAAALLWASALVELYPQTQGATSRELSKAISGDLTALQIAFVLILAYAIFILSKCDPVKGRALLALAGCVSVALSIGVAYGLSTGVGLKLNPVINVLPFILIGIGVDDMFVLVAALEAESAELEVPERLGRAMGKAGVSITITSVTDAVAFLLGTTSQLPALSTFCGFAAIGIAADFLLQVTFFAGWMALDARREKRRQADCCACCCAPVEASHGCCCCVCTYSDGQGACVKDGSFLKRLVVSYYIPLLRRPAVKAVVLVGFTALTACMAWSASNLKQDFQFRWFVPSDAALQETYDVQDEYYPSSGLPVNIVTPPSAEWDYAPIASQQQLVGLGEAIEGVEWIAQGSLAAWYGALREWVHECGANETFTSGALAGETCVRRDCTLPDGGGPYYPHCTQQKDGTAEAKYLVTADGAAAADGTPIGETFLPPERFLMSLDQFVASPRGARFASEVVWEDDAPERDAAAVERGLRNTRMRAQYKDVEDADEQVASMRDLRAAVEGSGVDGAFAYMFMYLYYEQYAIIIDEALQNLGLALLAVFLIVTLFVANLGATALVMLCVVLVDVDILGLMWLWGLSIDSVAIINLVLAVGLAVDYSCHLAHAFVQTPGTPGKSRMAQRQERADKALEEMGVAVIHGVASTFLAVLVLSASKSYIFVIFFKQFFGICLFGALHGLLLLPVLLSLVGPDPVAVRAPAGKADMEMPSPSPTPPVRISGPTSTAA